MTKTLRVLIPLLALAALAAADDESCLKCHADRVELKKARSDPSAPVERLLVDRERYARSVHGTRGCTECHLDFDTEPHTKQAETVQCAECHEEAAKKLGASAHGKAQEGQEGRERLPVACGACHGVHDVFKSSDPDSRLYPLNVYRTCGKCHFSLDPSNLTDKDILKQKYAGDAHGRGLLDSGLLVSATCISCHRGHDIRGPTDPASSVARTNVAETCGTCHVGVLAQYRKSVHHLKSNGEDHKGATCSDCHPAHEIVEPDAEFRGKTSSTCTRCHTQRGGSFRQTYHGKINSLGFDGKVATCEACHGHHTILPASDPASMVNPANLVTTCGQCHRKAHEEFTTYMVHADPGDGEHYPRIHFIWVLMNGLLIGTLILGGIHALLWLVRSLAAGEWRRPAYPANERHYRRWPQSYIAYHIALMTTVLFLAGTGLPLHYADKPWATRLMGFFGGAGAAGYVHRVAAISLVALFALYLGHVAYRVLVKREKGLFSGPDSMLPRWKDVEDLWGNLRWFLFLAPRPRYDRWTYWEKFDFWAVFWGLLVIGLSGLMLWFPEQATHYVPGWFINAAVIIHGIEALLDIAFIFTVHVFHANFRPDKFPMDTAFLSGVLPEHEFKHERPLEYERARAAGTLAALETAPPARRTRMTAYVIGTCALAVGFFFVAMMIVAVVQGNGH